MDVVKFIMEQMGDYILGLDWAYMLTFTILCFAIENSVNQDQLKRRISFLPQKKYRVFFAGSLYGALIYFIRNYSPVNIERLFQSFVFVLVFHKMLLEQFLKFLKERCGQWLRTKWKKEAANTNDLELKEKGGKDEDRHGSKHK